MVSAMRPPREKILLAIIQASCMTAAASIAGAQPRSSTSDCNQATPTAIATVKLPGHPFSTVATRDGCCLFVSLTSEDPKANGVGVLRRTGGTITVKGMYPLEARRGRDAMRPGPSGMVMTHDGQLLIAANDDDVCFLNVEALILGKSNPVVGRINDYEPGTGTPIDRGDRGPLAPPGSVYVNVTKGDTHLFVSDENAATITVIDLKKARGNYDRSAIVGKIPVGKAPVALTFSPDERWLYTTSGMASPAWNWPTACSPTGPNARGAAPEGAILVVDIHKSFTDPAHAVVAKAAAGCSPMRLAISNRGDTVWTSARGSNLVLAFDTSKLLNDPQDARIGSVPVGGAPGALVVLPDRNYLLVVNSNKWGADAMSPQNVDVIDMEKVQSGKAAVVGTIQAGAFPREFGQSPDGRALFLANYLSNTLEVIDVERLPVIAK
jgi:DNA-binding beta-propeller fold protein YncE